MEKGNENPIISNLLDEPNLINNHHDDQHNRQIEQNFSSEISSNETNVQQTTSSNANLQLISKNIIHNNEIQNEVISPFEIRQIYGTNNVESFANAFEMIEALQSYPNHLVAMGNYHNETNHHQILLNHYNVLQTILINFINMWDQPFSQPKIDKVKVIFNTFIEARYSFNRILRYEERMTANKVPFASNLYNSMNEMVKSKLINEITQLYGDQIPYTVRDVLSLANQFLND